MSLRDPRRQQQLHQLVRKLGLPEQATIQWSLLDCALTHPSASVEVNYEQLEFVGDAVIRLATAAFLFKTYPDCPVGEFTAVRSVLVSDRTLADIAKRYGLERYLLLSESARTDRIGRESRLAAALEAVAGALYLSTQTLELVHTWLDSHFRQLATEIRTDPARKNYKAALQEWTQAHYKLLPEYHVRETSQIHGDTERFTAEVWFRGKRLGSGKGPSKIQAEQAAAQAAFLTVWAGKIDLDRQN